MNGHEATRNLLELFIVRRGLRIDRAVEHSDPMNVYIRDRGDAVPVAIWKTGTMRVGGENAHDTKLHLLLLAFVDAVGSKITIEGLF